MLTTEEIMRQHINNFPTDSMPFLVYADYLEESGDSVKAAFYREIGMIFHETEKFRLSYWRERMVFWYYAITLDKKSWCFYKSVDTMPFEVPSTVIIVDNITLNTNYDGYLTEWMPDIPALEKF